MPARCRIRQCLTWISALGSSPASGFIGRFRSWREREVWREIGTGDVQDTANTALANAATAQTTATAAQGTANTAVANAATAQATADANTAAIAAETAARIAADALLAPLASPHFTGTALFAGGIGVWGHAAPGAQPATPVVLADVIAVLQVYGLTA